MKNNLGCVLYVLFVLLFAAVLVFIAYRISVSDLPPWFKFFLLGR